MSAKLLFFEIGLISGLLSLGVSYVNYRRSQKNFPGFVLKFCEVWSPWTYESREEMAMHQPDRWPTTLTLVGFLFNIPYWWIRLPGALLFWVMIVRGNVLDKVIGP